MNARTRRRTAGRTSTLAERVPAGSRASSTCTTTSEQSSTCPPVRSGAYPAARAAPPNLVQLGPDAAGRALVKDRITVLASTRVTHTCARCISSARVRAPAQRQKRTHTETRSCAHERTSSRTPAAHATADDSVATIPVRGRGHRFRAHCGSTTRQPKQQQSHPRRSQATRTCHPSGCTSPQQTPRERPARRGRLPAPTVQQMLHVTHVTRRAA
jgi:hypothetical protein